MRHPRRRGGAGIRDLIDRRTFLGASASLLLWPVTRRAWAEAATPSGPALPAATLQALERSPYVYVSPLRSDGNESTCHGEVWYGWIDGAVVLNTAPGTWKARAVAKGLTRARLWVGDHGRWKALLGRNEGFRKAPRFDAEAELVRGDTALLDRLLAMYETKYPDEIARWRDRMRKGYLDGSRVLVRYVPVPG